MDTVDCESIDLVGYFVSSSRRLCERLWPTADPAFDSRRLWVSSSPITLTARRIAFELELAQISEADVTVCGKVFDAKLRVSHVYPYPFF